MPHRIIQLMSIIASYVEWACVLGIGFFVSTSIDFMEDLHKIVVTIVSMALGTLVSHYIKSFINRKDKKK